MKRKNYMYALAMLFLLLGLFFIYCSTYYFNTVMTISFWMFIIAGILFIMSGIYILVTEYKKHRKPKIKGKY